MRSRTIMPHENPSRCRGSSRSKATGWRCNVSDQIFPLPIHSSESNNRRLLVSSSVENTSTIFANGFRALPPPVRWTGINGLFMRLKNGVDVNANTECEWLESVEEQKHRRRDAVLLY
jgi:hypothetical protein